MRRIIRRYFFELNEVGLVELHPRLHTQIWYADGTNETMARLSVCNEHGECHEDYLDCSVVEAYLQMFHLKARPKP